MISNWFIVIVGISATAVQAIRMSNETKKLLTLMADIMNGVHFRNQHFNNKKHWYLFWNHVLDLFSILFDKMALFESSVAERCNNIRDGLRHAVENDTFKNFDDILKRIEDLQDIVHARKCGKLSSVNITFFYSGILLILKLFS